MLHRRAPEALLGALLLLAGNPAATHDPAPVTATTTPPDIPDKPPLALFGTIPIYWGEGDGMADVLAGTATPHWARALLEQSHALQPLATLLPEELAHHRALLIAQPRVLSSSENVALDQWVRDGGLLLLFADPLLSAESHYPLGDPRRPQDVVLLSPLLRHWGLDLQFDPEQTPEREVREIAGMRLPHQLSGRFALVSDATCTVQGSGIVADCHIGRGHAVIVADAAVLDTYHPDAAAPDAMLALARQSFDPAAPLQNNHLAGEVQVAPVDKAVQNAP